MRKSKLADKIISSSLYENGVIKNLEQISYANINGQRQEANIYQPEGVQMLGQMGREKPLSAITKEMIKDYQEKELEAKFFKDGEPMLYKEAIYEPLLKTPIDIDDIKNDLRILYNNKIATSQAIKDAEDNIKALDDYYKAFMRDIRIF